MKLKNILQVSVLLIILLCGNAAAQNSVSNSRRNAITEAVEKVSPAVVGINVVEVVRQQNPFYDPFFSDLFELYGFGGQESYQKVNGLGSGFIISADGYIVTNNHVAGNASKIVVTTTDGDKYDAKIIGTDAAYDVALLKIEPKKKLPFVKVRTTNDVVIGEWAIAFGNPFGLFDLNTKPTITVGVVSNAGVSFIQDKSVYKEMIQTDAAISSGNSGGPLVNADGEVIGMNTIIFSTAQSGQGAGSIGIGWAIPASRFMEMVNKLKSGEKINRNFFLGMELQDLTDQYAQYYHIDADKGAFVTRTYRGYAADMAGIDPGDLIIKINGKDVKTVNDFYMQIYDGRVGDKFELTLLRGKQSITTVYTLQERK